MSLTATHLVPVQYPLPSQNPVAKTSVTSISGPAPRPVQQALTLLRAHQSGWRSNPWYRLPLSPAEFEDLRRRLARDTDLAEYVSDTVRFDYIPDASEFVVRMPFSIHELFTRKVLNTILQEIHTFAGELPPTSALSRFLGDIETFGSTDVYAADDSRHRRSPDHSIRCKGTRFPAIVIETAYSQSEKKLRRVAHDWIVLSHGNVKMVIGLEMNYQLPLRTSSGTQVGQVLVWEPVLRRELDHDILTSQCTFQKTLSRHPSLVASHATTDALAVSVRALAPRVTLSRYQVPEHQRSWKAVSISVSNLALILDECQKTFELDQGYQGEEDPLSVHTLIKRWSLSSEEQLTEEDEDRWRQRELVALPEADNRRHGLEGVAAGLDSRSP